MYYEVYYSVWVNISAEIFPGSVAPTRSLTPSHMGRDLSDISLYQDSLRGRLPSPARDVRRSLRLLFHPGLGFLRGVTHAVCPALRARARRPTVGRPCRPAPLVPSCTSGVLPPPYPPYGEGEGGDACCVFEKKRGTTRSRVHRPDPQRACSRVHRPTSRNPVRDVYQARYLYSTTLFHLLARPTGMTAASPPRPRAPSRGAGS